MSSFVFGDIVLIKFPYTDFSATKKRPALVLYDTGDDDIIVCRVTSQPRETDFDIDIKDWQKAGLKFQSTVRLHKVVTIEASLVDKKMGVLPPVETDAVQI